MDRTDFKLANSVYRCMCVCGLDENLELESNNQSDRQTDVKCNFCYISVLLMLSVFWLTDSPLQCPPPQVRKPWNRDAKIATPHFAISRNMVLSRAKLTKLTGRLNEWWPISYLLASNNCRVYLITRIIYWSGMGWVFCLG